MSWKLPLSRRCIVGISVGVVVLGWVGFNLYQSSPAEHDTITSGQRERKSGYMEDNTGATPIDIEQKEQVEQDVTDLLGKLGNPQKVTQSPTVNIKGHRYYIFGDDILMPLDENWTEYDIPAAADGKYARISEYYLRDESPNNWTQKFTIHKVNSEFKESGQEFMERLITGILVTLSDRMEVEGNTLSKDDVSVNYIKKDENDAIVYWGLPGLGEVQFARVFRSEQTNDLYVVTASYKMDIADISTDFAEQKRAELLSIQQLKRKS